MGRNGNEERRSEMESVEKRNFFDLGRRSAREDLENGADLSAAEFREPGGLAASDFEKRSWAEGYAFEAGLARARASAQSGAGGCCGGGCCGRGC